SHPADEPLGQPLGLVVGKERPVSRRAEDIQLVVVENDLKLVRLVEVFQGIEKFRLRRRQPARLAHAGRAIDAEREAVALIHKIEELRFRRFARASGLARSVRKRTGAISAAGPLADLAFAVAAVAVKETFAVAPAAG